MINRVHFSLRFLVFALVVITAACVARQPHSKQKTLRIQIGADPVTLDPSLVESGYSLRILANTMDGLFGYDAEGNLKARIARSMNLSEDKLRYEFELKKEARWSDGRPVRPEDFVAGLRRALHPKTPSKLAAPLLVISGARAYREGASPNLPGVRAEKNRLVIEVSKPAPYLLQALTLPTALPLRSDVLKRSKNRWPHHAPVTGSYKIASYVAGQAIILERNPHYWNYEKPAQVENIRLEVVNRDETAVQLFQTGKIDVLTRVPPFDVPLLNQYGRVEKRPYYATYFLAFNIKKRPFGLPFYRKAVSGAIRREQLIEALGSGEKAASSWIPGGLEGSQDYRNPRFVFWDSIKKVRERLKEITLGKVGAAFDSNPRNQLVMEKVQSDVKRLLGFELSLTQMDFKSYVGKLATDAPALFRFAWMAPFKDPITHLQVFTTGNPNNYTNWSSRQYDQMVEEIGYMEPGPDRVKLIRKAQKFLVEEHAVVVPLFHYVQTHAISPRVQNFAANPFRIVPYAQLALAE